MSAVALLLLTTEDAVADRGFLRQPSHRGRWKRSAAASLCTVAAFAGAHSPCSMAYSLPVIGAMSRWLIQQRHTLSNPFPGIRGSRGVAR